MTELAPSRTPVSVAGFEGETAGVVPPVDSNRQGAFLTDVIVELGFADKPTVAWALEVARRSEQTVEQSLLDSGALDEEQLALAIAERNGLDHVDLGRFDVDMEAAAMISRSTALRYRAVPISFAADGALIVAVENPSDSLGISDIEAMTRSEVRPAVATASGIRALSERLPDVEAIQPPVPPEPQPHGAPAAALPEPEVEAPQSERPDPAPEPAPTPRVERSDLAAELHALQEAASRADAMAAAVGRRIEELEGADRRAGELEGQLAAAQERAAELERRLSRMGAAAGEARKLGEKLGALCRSLEQIAP